MEFTTNRIPVKNKETEPEFPCHDRLNEQRSKEELKRWWNVPYIDELYYEETGAIGVFVLDGSTWDNPRKISEHDSFDEAVSAAGFYVKHSPLWRKFDEPYEPTARIEHLMDMSPLIHGKLKKPSKEELFSHMFSWLPESDAKDKVKIVG
ncbi:MULTISPECIES: hypothetical protein [Photobacterium]|uniref:Uncharacterized protein n=1 Tax=Photobacterium ganghwense TaxID=320778 RepID=A0A0J1HFQ1_9GAMM|nr:MULTISPECIES: hypothetical protein [Photobacterium]KLV10453.1 hypothetical protein ABT57_07880 [Photobacterium ganghwense]MBV1841309.1 hypothetical protein [Photobacterium ganghwense]PSU09648.1 hypothetical protein C9I92_09010 [Photobacterium ganghwense]QSV16896.1 hypothetical protein FH974_18220 [Photobacterium ganghwense]